MNAKRYLSQIRHLDRKIRILSDEIAQYEAMATRITPVLEKLNVQTSPDNRKEDAMIQFVEATMDLSRMLNEYSAKRNEILEQLMRLNRSEYIDILYKRYFELKKWETICAEMLHSDTWIYNTHGKALREFSQIIEKKE